MAKTRSTTRDPMAWWREARFGMFIHWGLYAVPAGVYKGKKIDYIGEWIMHNEKIRLAEYRRYARSFTADRFDARAWVQVARDAGMKYLVITAKHHDGFALYDSAASDYNIVKQTPFGRDPMKELARECRRAGIRLCFYYSQDIDWEHPDGSRNTWDFDPAKKDFGRYLREKVKPQLRELLSGYGPVGLIWCDCPVSISRAQSRDLKRFIKRLQPDCLVSGRVGHNVGDYGSLGDNEHPAGPVKGDWETPCTVNDTWGFKTHDHNWKPVSYLLRLLVNCAGKGVNYLLNVGPTARGVIPAPSVTRLRQVGAWMRVNGEAIYGTRGNAFPHDFDWGQITQRDGRLYLLFTRWPGGTFTLRGLRNRVKRATLLANRRARIGVSQTHSKADDEHSVVLDLPRRAPDRIVSVVALDIAGKPDVVPYALQQPDGAIHLSPHMADIIGPKTVTVGRSGAMQGWKEPGVLLAWTFRVFEPGSFRVGVRSHLNWHVPERFGNHWVVVSLKGQSVRGEAGIKDMVRSKSTTSWHIGEADIGTLMIAGRGMHTLTLRAERLDPKATAGFTLTGVRLVRSGVKQV